MARLEVLNPVADTVKHDVKAAPRPSDLRGKTVGLYWNMKAGGDIALERAATLLSQRFEGLQFQHFSGTFGSGMRHATAEDADRIARNCVAVVASTSD